MFSKLRRWLHCGRPKLSLRINAHDAVSLTLPDSLKYVRRSHLRYLGDCAALCYSSLLPGSSVGGIYQETPMNDGSLDAMCGDTVHVAPPSSR